MTDFRYRKPGYVALHVTDLDRSVHFYRDVVGLALEERSAHTAYLTCSDDHHNVVLCQATVPGIKRMAFELESESDLAAAERHLRSMGWDVQVLDDAAASELKQGRTLRFKLPHSHLCFEFYAAMARAATPYAPTVAKIQRLGHVVVGVADRDAVLKVLTEQLNFRVSDYFGDQVAFLRCFPNPYHHSFGVTRAAEDRFHHLNFMVSDIDDVGRATNRLRKHGAEIVYGPGRHDISTSIFLYFLDPDGLTAEYSFGMEEFPPEGARDPRQLPPRLEILDAWGGAPAERFAQVGTIES